jgi:hypothetical protein
MPAEYVCCMNKVNRLEMHAQRKLRQVVQRASEGGAMRWWLYGAMTEAATAAAAAAAA